MASVQLSGIADNIITDVLLNAVGSHAVAIIRRRVNKGEYLDGSSAGAENYSTTPMPLPFGAFSKAVRSKLLPAGYKVFTNVKSHTTWIVLPGGYKEFRQLAGKANDKVNLQWTGRMMRNLGFTSSTQSGRVSLGFTDPDAEQLAVYHNTMGAGKSRTKHVFMDFTEDEINQLVGDVEKYLLNRLEQML